MLMNLKYYSNLSPTNALKQIAMVEKSRRLYKKGQYYNRTKLNYPKKTSSHIIRAKKLYGTAIKPSRALAERTGCSIQAMNEIVRKGEGAYYSSGSRPSQTPQSWAYARLASSVSGGNAAKVDFHIIKTCDPTKPAFQLATKRIRRRSNSPF
jgi:hypothetical protein